MEKATGHRVGRRHRGIHALQLSIGLRDDGKPEAEEPVLQFPGQHGRGSPGAEAQHPAGVGEAVGDADHGGHVEACRRPLDCGDRCAGDRAGHALLARVAGERLGLQIGAAERDCLGQVKLEIANPFATEVAAKPGHRRFTDPGAPGEIRDRSFARGIEVGEHQYRQSPVRSRSVLRHHLQAHDDVGDRLHRASSQAKPRLRRRIAHGPPRTSSMNGRHPAVRPASTGRETPVMPLARSEARKATASATSRASTTRCKG